MNEERRDPLPKRGVEQKLRVLGTRRELDPNRLRKILTALTVAQMLPEDTLVKGGNSLSMTFPLAQTRFSTDLDLVVSEGFESWKEKFSQNLDRGCNGFTGELVRRGEAHEHPHVKVPIQIFSYDVKLRYLGKQFATLPLDITSANEAERERSKRPLSADVRELMDYLGFDAPAGLNILPVEAQLAQKSAAMFSDAPRPGDIVDMNLLFAELDEEGSVQTYETLLSYELNTRAVPVPYRIENPNLLRQQYLASFTDERTLEAVISRVKATVKRIERRESKGKQEFKALLDEKHSYEPSRTAAKDSFETSQRRAEGNIPLH